MKPVRLSRRALLRGAAGVAIALPTLEAMLSPRGLLWGGANAQAAAAPVRLVSFYFPCGTVLEDWTPTTTGGAYTLSPALQALGGTTGFASVREHVNVLSNLRKQEYKDNVTEYTSESHLRGTASFATGVGPSPDGLGAGGPSFDQFAVQKLNPTTKLPSLVVSTGKSIGVNQSHISWSKARTPVPAERSPKALFAKLFAESTGNETQAQLEQLAARRKSVLDAVQGDLTRLKQRVGHNDVARIDEHLESIREVERQLTFVPPGGAVCETPAEPADGLSPPERTKLMLRLLALGLKCDLTRVASFQLYQRQDELQFPWLGINKAHHDVSHESTALGLAQQTKIVQWEVEMFAYFLDQLRAAKEGAGSVLDNSVVFFSSEHQEGRTHEYKDMPVLLAGAGGGKFKTGRHIRYADGTPFGRVFVSALQAVGAPVTKFGTYGDGPLAGLES